MTAEHAIDMAVVKRFRRWNGTSPNILPVKGIEKRPGTFAHYITWTPFKTTPMTAEQEKALFRKNDPFDALSIISGVNDWRCFDFDACLSTDAVFELLDALGLPENYEWVVKTGSQKGYHVWFLCDALPASHALPGKEGETGVFTGKGNGFDHLELRWERCQTLVPPSIHKSGNHYEFLFVDSTPETPPARVTGDRVVAAFRRVTVLDYQKQEQPQPARAKTPKSTQEDEWQAVKTAVTPEQVFEAIGWSYKTESGNHIGECPLHSSESGTPLRWSLDGGFFKCFHAGCSAGGDLIEFVKLFRGGTPLDAARWMTDRFAPSLRSKFQTVDRPPHPAEAYDTQAHAPEPTPADAPPAPPMPEAAPHPSDVPCEIPRFIPKSTLITKDGLPALEYYELTEYGLRQRYLDQFRNHLRFNFTADGWMLFDGQRWIDDTHKLSSELIPRLIEQLEIDAKRAEKLLVARWQQETESPYKPEKDRTTKESIHLKRQAKTKELAEKIDPLINYAQAVKAYCYESKRALKRTVSHIIDLATHDQSVAMTEEEVDRDPYLLNVQNGTLDLRTDTLTPHNPAQLLSKIAGTEYNPTATCPEFQKFLNMIFEGDAELIAYIQRCFGYSLTGLSAEKVLLFCYGKSGDNGKSTLFNAIQQVLGDYFSTAQAEILMESRRPAGGALEGLANLKGTRCVVTDELSGASTMDIAVVKRLTGADHAIKARKLFGHEFSFSPSHTLWMFGNEKPRITATDQAIWNRVKTIPFTYKIPEDQQIPMPQVMATFQREAAGILNWMLEGWRVYRDDKKGLNMAVPEKIQIANQQYREEEDTLKSFLEECFINGYNLVKTRVDGGVFPSDEHMLNAVKVARPELWQTYKTWCLTFKSKRMKQADVWTYLEEHGFPIREGRANQWFVHGLKFQTHDRKSSDEQPPLEIDEERAAIMEYEAAQARHAR